MQHTMGRVLPSLFLCRTNSGKEQDMIFGHHTAGLLGYSHLVGGYEGGQAEYLRVPFGR